MPDTAISVIKVSKRYRIGQRQTRYKTFRETLGDVFLTPFRRVNGLLRRETLGSNGDNSTIWALKETSFEVKRGEIVGIIGRNGAGKSTMLKILSRITEPTEGRCEIHGRVGSLLEVGTGFHQELTGRENIYLNGAILGMKRTDIDKKFDEIVDFAEVEKFIDTPVKHYSSGMYLRLAFAVAAHLEPEILLVDEVLAVGDSRFQKKCLNKMHDVGKLGRTVLFVSHNMPAITRLCERAILFEDGAVVKDGPAHEVVSAYLSGEIGTASSREWSDIDGAPSGEIVRLRSIRIKSEEGVVFDSVDIRKPVGIEMEYEVLKPGYSMSPIHQIFNEEGLKIFTAVDSDPKWTKYERPVGRYVSTAWIPGNLLTEGMLFVASAIYTLEPFIKQFYVRDAVSFHVVDSMGSDSARGEWAGKLSGVVRPMLVWKTELSPNGQKEQLQG